MKRIVVMCPANFASGGPELLHQLCWVLREKKYNAQMCYYGFKNKNLNPVDDKYKSYDNPYMVLSEYREDKDDIIILPEVYTKYFHSYKRVAKIVIWWLSVDNFFASTSGNLYRIFKKIGFTNKFFLNKVSKTNEILNCIKEISNITFFVQSWYALEFCKKEFNLSKDNIFYLSDYLNPLFIEKSKKTTSPKENVVLYNPKKGVEFTNGLIEYAKEKNISINWVPLINLSREDMSNRLLSSKVYIDFGEHPGKDRIPREAAISGCCVITGKRGSAKYYQDVPIPAEYKFDDNKTSYPKIINKILCIFENYDNEIKNFNEYKQFIESEYDKFLRDVDAAFSSLCNR